MTIEDIQIKFEQAQQKENNNEEIHATIYTMSYFFSNDMRQVKLYCDAINKELNVLKSSIKNIVGRINTEWESSFYNTYGDLVKVSNNIPEKITQNIENAVETASRAAFDKYTTDYTNNKQKIDDEINQVDNGIKKWYEEEKEKTLTEQELDRIDKSLEPKNYNKLKSELANIKQQQKGIVLTCSIKITTINNLNQQNEELLTKGLKKA